MERRSAACVRWTRPPIPISSVVGSSAGSPRRRSRRRGEDGVDLIFNTPNEKSGAGYLKMGWGEVGPIGVMVRPGLGLLRRHGAEGIPETEELLPGSEPLDDFPPVTTRPPRGLRTPRTDDYLRWRFTAHPTARYAAVGAGSGLAVVRPNLRGGRRELVLSELIGPGSAAARASRPPFPCRLHGRLVLQRESRALRRRRRRAGTSPQGGGADAGGSSAARPPRRRHLASELGSGIERPGVAVSAAPVRIGR